MLRTLLPEGLPGRAGRWQATWPAHSLSGRLARPCAGAALLLLLRGRAHTGFAGARRLAMALPQRLALCSGLSTS